MGTVFNIQRSSLFDGPGVRTVVFLKGCPLRCIWCHNPEGLIPKKEISYNAEGCIACGDCADICRRGCHSVKGGLHAFDRSLCVACGDCAEACFSRSLAFYGEEMTVGEVMATVLRDREIYRASGGGLTLSGGEPLFQSEFSGSLLKAAKDEGIHTAVETSGYGDPEALSRMAEYTDVFLFDYKVTGREAYEKYCGVSDDVILQNLALLEGLKSRVILRCPLIPDINIDTLHAKGIANIAALFKDSVSEIQLLPYHRLGIPKAKRLGLDVGFDSSAPDGDTVTDFARELDTLCNGDIKIRII